MLPSGIYILRDSSSLLFILLFLSPSHKTDFRLVYGPIGCITFSFFSIYLYEGFNSFFVHAISLN